MNTSRVPLLQHSALRRLLPYVLRYRRQLVLAVGLSVLITILGVGSISMLKPIVETLFGIQSGVDASGVESRLRNLLEPLYAWIEQHAAEHGLWTLAMICGVFLVIAALRNVLRFIHTYTTQWVGNRVVLDLQKNLFSQLTHYHAAYFARHTSGELLSYFSSDIRLVGNSIFKAFGYLLLDPVLLIGCLVFLFFLQWKLTLAFLLIVPAVVISVRIFARRNRHASRQAQDLLARLGGFLQDHFRHIRTVQLYNMTGPQDQRFDYLAQAGFEAMMRRVRAWAASSPVSEFIGMVAMCVVLILGGYVILVERSLPPQDFFVYLAALFSVYQPTKRIERCIQEIQHGLAAADRVFEAMREEARLPQRTDAIVPSGFHQSIRFEQVWFSYDGETPVLCDIQLEVQRGEQIALVGPSGSGKTTLVNLIPRFFDPERGRLLMDGVDLRDLDLNGLRSQVAYVSQSPAVFADTVWFNLTCGEAHSREAVEAAARSAYADEFIEALPDGYDTVLGEDGVSLSGGQAQRLAIARAFVRDAPILILDEATSALDSESERRVKESLQRLAQGRTTFTIAHRLATILQADRIVVLDAGRIVDVGGHHALLQRCDLYRNLYELQFHVQELRDASQPTNAPR